MRKDLRVDQPVITDDTLHEWDTETRELYFKIDEALYAGPKLCNTDGHPLECYRRISEVDIHEPYLL